MIPGSNYDSPEFLAYIATRKYQYGLPFYRLEQLFDEDDIPVSRTTMARLINECVDRRLTALYELLKAELRHSNILHADETNFQVLKEPGRKPQAQSFLWLYCTSVNADRSIVLFDYQQTRAGEHPRVFLTEGDKPFSGTLVCDGYAGYKKLNVILAGCWAHARRKFEGVLKQLPAADRSCGGFAQQGFEFIQRLYVIERRIREYPPDAKYLARQRDSRPILDQFKEWLIEHEHAAPKGTSLGTAIRYTLGEWSKLARFVDNGNLPIDNNEAERQIKQVVIGRKNWLFADSVAGGYTNAVMYSLVRTAMVNGLDPYEYLKQVFTELPSMTTAGQVARLLPWNIKAAHDGVLSAA